MGRYTELFLFPPDTRFKLIELGLMLQAAYAHDQNAMETAFLPLGNGPVHRLKWDTGIEDEVWVKFGLAGDLLVVDSGTQTLGVLITQIFNRTQAGVVFDSPWLCGAFWLTRAYKIWTAFKNYEATISAYYGNDRWTMTMAGHSLGAAEAVCFGAIAQNNGYDPLRFRIISFGCPRVMNPFGAVELKVPHLRLHGQGDPINHVPPRYDLVLTPNRPAGGFRPLITAEIRRWEHHGNALLLGFLGELVETESDPSELPVAYLDVLYSIYAGGIPSHSMVFYLYRLGLKSDPPSGGLPYSGGFGSMADEITCSMHFIHSPTGQGWSEGFYLVGQDIDDAFKTLDKIAARRANCLSNDGVLRAIRVSNVDVLGDAKESLPFYRNLVDFGPCEAFYQNILVQPYAASTFQPGKTYNRNYYFGLVPDKVIEGNQVKMAALPAFKIAFDAYFAYLKSQVCRMRAWNKSAAKVQIKTVTVSLVPPIGEMIVVCKAGHGIPVGDTAEVKVHGLKLRPSTEKLQGTVAAVGIDALSFAVAGKLFDTSTRYYKGGTVQARVYIYPPMANFPINGCTSKHRGKPRGLRRGRRRAPSLT